MKYVIMCGGKYIDDGSLSGPKHLTVVHGERLIDRTIRLLTENNVSKEDIIITISDINVLKYYDSLGVSVILRHDDYEYVEGSGDTKGYWVDAFCNINEPATYIFGDVYFSEACIRKIVITETDDVLFFAQSRPFAHNYIKPWVEPFAFKVVNTKRFFEAVDYAKKLDDEHKGWRPIIAWELWAILKGLPIDVHFFRKGSTEVFGEGFVPIQDYSCDIDSAQEVIDMEWALEREKLNIPGSLKKIFGIISYLPDDKTEREKRIARLESLLYRLWQLFPTLPVIIIGQNYGRYKPHPKQKLVFCNYKEGLGIINARQALRYEFLKTGYDYLIMFDDDAIVDCPDRDTANEYLRRMDENPQGFAFVKGDSGSICPYAKSQLNFCAVSRYIYEKEPIPYIDPQKGQAFEDSIWSTLLHYKYSELEFDVPEKIKCAHFKNPNIEKLGGEVRSTWSKEADYNWKILRANTSEVLKYISINHELPNLDEMFKDKVKVNIVKDTDKIDLVVPYVDMQDDYWRWSYSIYSPEEKSLATNGNNRFRGNEALFRYFFRCVEKNLPWINNVYLLVQSDEQVPSWVNRDKVKIIKHYEFIPEEFLPTFNSCTIEMFLWNIPGLSEKFLYANDDFYLLNKTEPGDWFGEGSKAKFTYKLDDNLNPEEIYYNQLRSNVKVISPEKEGIGFRLFHMFKPYYRSRVRDCYFKYLDKIVVNISRFRENKNNNSYIFNYYDYVNGYQEKTILNHKYCSFAYLKDCINVIEKKLYDTIVINDDAKIISDNDYILLTKAFDKYFGNKSIYEVEDAKEKLNITNNKRIFANKKPENGHIDYKLIFSRLKARGR